MKQIHDLRAALPLFRCLSSETRVAILELLEKNGTMRMTDIAEALGVTGGTLSPHMKLLAECGLISIAFSAGKHGVQRDCSLGDTCFLIDPQRAPLSAPAYEAEISVGQYTGYEVYPTCGLATPERLIGEVDDPRYFASPERVDCDILWLGHGYVEYMIPNYLKPNERASELQISMEISSEAPGYCENWPSDITFSLNGVTLCSWTCPGDFGATRGIYIPAWWDRSWNQHGQFKLLTVNETGCYIDGTRYSDRTLSQLGIAPDTPLTLRIASPLEARNPGGLTLYGRSFGNYAQDIRVRMVYERQTAQIG